MLDVFLTTYEVRKNVGGFILQNVRTHIVSNACDGRGIMLSLSPTCVCVCVLRKSQPHYLRASHLAGELPKLSASIQTPYISELWTSPTQ